MPDLIFVLILSPFVGMGSDDLFSWSSEEKSSPHPEDDDDVVFLSPFITSVSLGVRFSFLVVLFDRKGCCELETHRWLFPPISSDRYFPSSKK